MGRRTEVRGDLYSVEALGGWPPASPLPVERFAPPVAFDIHFEDRGMMDRRSMAARVMACSGKILSHSPNGWLAVMSNHSQIVQLECLRSGIWGAKSTWGALPSTRGSSGYLPLLPWERSYV